MDAIYELMAAFTVLFTAACLFMHRYGGCRFGLHSWGPIVNVPVRHLPDADNEYEHVCSAERRYCGRCGKNGDLKNVCKHGKMSSKYQSTPPGRNSNVPPTL